MAQNLDKLHTKFELARFLPYKMTMATERLTAGLAKQYGQKFNISIADWRVLVHVSDAGNVSIRELHQRAHLEKSKASRAASRLVEAGYLSKTVDENDRRLVELKLTPAGTALMTELLALATEYQSRLDKLLAPYEAALVQALETIIEEDEL